jgi:energy-coupling factor transporter ATP-binding protein EcfA2
MANPVEIRGFKYCYPGVDRPALTLEELSIERGEFCCLVGVNGAGKSTLCRVLSGLIPHFYRGEMSGSVQIFGQETCLSSIDQLAGKVGYVMDDPFDQLTRATYSVYNEIAFGLQNVGMPVDQIRSRVRQVLEELDIAALAERLPTTLSGGEQQRVAIASIFARDPEVLVMDEATSQLDPQGTESIFQLVKHFKEMGKTVVMVEPKLDKMLQHADRILFIHEGQVVASGSLQVVLESGIFEQVGLGLPSYPALAKELMADSLYDGNLPVNITQATNMVQEVLNGGN